MLVRSNCLLAFLLAAHRAAAAKETTTTDINPILVPIKYYEEGDSVSNPSPYIIEGTEADIGQYPYYVHMQIQRGVNTYSCGGSLIAPQVILSAAHCNDPYFETNVEKGYIGATRFWSTENGAVLGECEEWENHPDFVPIIETPFGGIAPGTSVLGGNDFALCLLKEPVDIDMSNVKLVLNDDLSYPPESSDVMTESVGMGRTSGDRSEGTDVLLRADLPLLPQDACADRYDEIDDTMICTFDDMDDTMSGVCSGDSGGPIVIPDGIDDETGATIIKQVGVVSWGSGLCGTNPDVHARVSAGMPWIRRQVCGEWGLSDSVDFCATGSTSPTMAPTEFDCDTDQILTVEVQTDSYPGENDWILEKYDNDVWTVVESDDLNPPNTLIRSVFCLEEGALYRFTIFDSFGDGLCYFGNCGFYEVDLNGVVIAEGDDFGSSDVTVFNTCVDEPGTFTVKQRGNNDITATCDELRDYLITQPRKAGTACRANNVGGPGRVRDFCPSTCGVFNKGVCAPP